MKYTLSFLRLLFFRRRIKLVFLENRDFIIFDDSPIVRINSKSRLKKFAFALSQPVSKIQKFRTGMGSKFSGFELRWVPNFGPELGSGSPIQEYNFLKSRAKENWLKPIQPLKSFEFFLEPTISSILSRPIKLV